MESEEQRRRRYEQSNYPRGYTSDYGTPGANTSGLQHFRGAQLAENSDQFRHGALSVTRTPTSTSLAASAGPPQDLGSFPYSQGQQYQAPQMQAPSFQYQPGYLHDPQRQRYPQYASQMMYNVPQQPQPQSPYIPQTQSSYEPIAQYQPRQTAAAEVLSNQFGVPHYYCGVDAPSTVAPPVMPQGYQTAPYPSTVPYDPSSALGRSTLASPYPTVPSDLGQTGGSEENAGQGTDPAADNTDRYYRALGETNYNTSRGMLIEAGNSLLQITDWLLGNAVRLGQFSIITQRLPIS